MPTISLTLPRPHPAQRAILANLKRFNVLACGRRFGKTTLGIHRLIGPMLAGQPVAWFAPNYKYLSEVWRDFLRLLTPVIRYKNRSDWRVELVTGGSIEFWTLLDPDSGRSRKYAGIVVDEAAKSRNLEICWNESIRATLTDYRGWADFYSTPKGQNFFKLLFDRGQDPLEPEWASWSLPTSTNPYIDPAEVEAARRQLPERVFAQEYLATFLEEAAGVFRGVTAAVDRGRRAADPPRPTWQYTHGADLARVEDFTVLSTLDPGLRQARFERFNQVSWERALGAITALDAAYPGDLVLDCTGVGDPIYERAAAEGLSVTPYHFTNASKNALIDNLAMGLERGKLRLLDVPEQTAELLAYEYSLTPSRKVTMSAPPGQHDDCVTALALAYWGAAHTREVTAAASDPFALDY